MDSQPEFAAGQLWTYDTRPDESASRVVICRVEEHQVLGQIVHIHIRGLRLKSKCSPGGFTDTITHMPYGADSLRESVVSLEATGAPLPPFEEGYREWRAAFDQGQAGVWGLPVKERHRRDGDGVEPTVVLTLQRGKRPPEMILFHRRWIDLA